MDGIAKHRREIATNKGLLAVSVGAGHDHDGGLSLAQEKASRDQRAIYGCTGVGAVIKTEMVCSGAVDPIFIGVLALLGAQPSTVV
jgi:hypothetical protein